MPWTPGLSFSVGEIPTAAKLNSLVGNIDYAHDIASNSFTSGVNVTGTAFVDIVSAGAITYAATPIVVEFYAVRVAAGATDTMVLSLRDGATDLGRVLALPASQQSNPCYLAVKITPTAASHTYVFSAKNLTAQTSTVYAGAGGADLNMPGYIRIRGIAS